MDIIVGTAGHIDHGKTALVKALTGIDADRLPEEKRRGITVDLGFAEMTVGDVHFGFVDVPGHEKFVRNMLAGASGIDIVLLVVAADEGVMPQTREHFEICRLLDIKAGVIALTKSDLGDSDTLDLARLEVSELVNGSFLENAPMIAVSSRTGAGVEEIKAALGTVPCSTESRRDNLVARLPIDRSFSVKGFGTVVTGTLASGEIDSASRLELLPERIPVRVRGLQTHGSSTDAAKAGQRTAVNLAGVDHEKIERGMTLAEAGVLEPTQVVDARVEMLRDAKPLRSRRRVRVHIGTAEVMARIRVLEDSGEIAGGEKGFVQIRLERPVVAIAGERFVIRSYSPQRTVAGGELIDNNAKRHRKKDLADVRRMLAKLIEQVGDRGAFLKLLIENAGTSGIQMRDLIARTALKPAMLERSLNELITNGVISESSGKYYTSKFLPKAAVAEEPHEEIVLSDTELAFTEYLLSIYREAKLNVPRTDDAIERAMADLKLTTAETKKLLAMLIAEGKLVRVSDEFCFDRDVIDKLKANLRSFADTTTERVIDVPKFKELFAVSRKYAIPLLEHFDRVNVTRRFAEKRIVLK